MSHQQVRFTPGIQDIDHLELSLPVTAYQYDPTSYLYQLIGYLKHLQPDLTSQLLPNEYSYHHPEIIINALGKAAVFFKIVEGERIGITSWNVRALLVKHG